MGVAATGDAGYDRVYLVASRDPIDLSGTLDDAMSTARVVDAYATDTILDSHACPDGRRTSRDLLGPQRTECAKSAKRAQPKLAEPPPLALWGRADAAMIHGSPKWWNW